jgi:hypothetical protein
MVNFIATLSLMPFWLLPVRAAHSDDARND